MRNNSAQSTYTHSPINYCTWNTHPTHYSQIHRKLHQMTQSLHYIQDKTPSQRQFKTGVPQSGDLSPILFSFSIQKNNMHPLHTRPSQIYYTTSTRSIQHHSTHEHKAKLLVYSHTNIIWITQQQNTQTTTNTQSTHINYMRKTKGNKTIPRPILEKPYTIWLPIASDTTINTLDNKEHRTKNYNWVHTRHQHDETHILPQTKRITDQTNTTTPHTPTKPHDNTTSNISTQETNFIRQYKLHHRHQEES